MNLLDVLLDENNRDPICMSDDEAIAFYVDMRGEEPALKVVERESTALTIFEKYYDLLEAEAANRGQK